MRSTSALAFTSAHRAAMIDVAQRSIAEMLRRGAVLEVEETEHDERLRAAGASFVTLERGEALLGCIGTLDPVRPLISDVAHNARAAAFSDPRLPAIGPDDYAVMAIEISVLSELEPLRARSIDELRDELRPGVDGIVLAAPRGRATFLPAVWRHFGDDVDGFLAALWRKAGQPSAVWPDGARCSRYTAEQIIDSGPRAPLSS